MSTLIRLLFSVLAVALVAAAPSAERSPGSSPRRKSPRGDLQWAPRPFVFQPGASVRYIDFEAGDDDNPATRNEPWRHHPWDAPANAKAGMHGRSDLRLQARCRLPRRAGWPKSRAGPAIPSA